MGGFSGEFDNSPVFESVTAASLSPGPQVQSLLLADLVFRGMDSHGRTAVITGGYGTLGGSKAEHLAAAGVRVGVLGQRNESAEKKAEALREIGPDALPLVANVLDKDALESAKETVLEEWGRLDILINAAGGNVADARTGDDRSFFDIPQDAFREVVELNLDGTVLPTQVFGEIMAEQEEGSIVNISSMAAHRAITEVPGYSPAKAGVENFTKWMAVEAAREFGEGVRVNAVAPGFFIAKQNRDVMLNPDGSYTERTQTVLQNTPMGRLGAPSELNGAAHWLCSDAASFVTGVVIPVDGGFNAFSGV